MTESDNLQSRSENSICNLLAHPMAFSFLPSTSRDLLVHVNFKPISMMGNQTVVVQLEAEFWKEAPWIRSLISVAGKATSPSWATETALHLWRGWLHPLHWEVGRIRSGNICEIHRAPCIWHRYNTKPEICPHVSFSLKTGRLILLSDC